MKASPTLTPLRQLCLGLHPGLRAPSHTFSGSGGLREGHRGCPLVLRQRPRRAQAKAAGRSLPASRSPVGARGGSAVLGEGQVLPSRGGWSPLLGRGESVLGEGGLSTPPPPPAPLCVPRAVQEKELVHLLAQCCAVQLGASVRSQAVQELLPSCVPPKLYRTKPPEKWASLVTAALAEVSSPEPVHSGCAALYGGPGGPRVCRADGDPMTSPHSWGVGRLTCHSAEPCLFRFKESRSGPLPLTGPFRLPSSFHGGILP